MRVAIQGEPGSFSERAAIELCGDGVALLACPDFDALFAMVMRGRSDVGVVPITNTIVGTIYDNEARARSAAFVVQAAYALKVSQCVIVRADRGAAPITRMASHAIALRQCSRWFATHPNCEPVPIVDTAGGVRDLMLRRLDVDGVIASEHAAARYGGVVAERGVQDVRENFTEFLRFRLR